MKGARMYANLRPWVAPVPWWGKIAAKLILARLPVDYKVWKWLHLFECGKMEDAGYAYGVFKRHFDAARSRRAFNNFVGLELGPGDSLFSAMIAYAYDASAYHLVDVGPFAQFDTGRYRPMASFLEEQGLPTIKIDSLTSSKSFLTACHATYGTRGLISLRAIPDHSVDYSWSHTVLQHVPLKEFQETLKELRRQLRPDGISSHLIDLQDCLGGSLNNLRFSESVWESPFMANSGFYTNRIRYSEMLELFKEARFAAEVVNVKRWDRLPIERSKLSPRFQKLSDDELRVQSFHVILKPV